MHTPEQVFSEPFEPEAVHSGAFTYTPDGHLLFDGYPRATWRQLEFRAKSAEIPWIVAQLSLWGIPFRETDTDLVLRAKLRSALGSIQSSGISPAVRAIEASLRKAYEKQMQEFEKAHLDWRKQEFSKLRNPSDEANFDAQLFVAKYFLTEHHGTPDKTKQKTPLILSEKGLNTRPLSDCVLKIPGLVIRETNVGTVVGWKEAIPPVIKELFATLQRQQHTLPDGLQSAEAEFDIDLFLAKYFLKESTGQSDPRKTRYLVRVRQSMGMNLFLEKAVREIPGLHIRTTKSTGVFFDGYFYIGWDLERIEEKVRAVNQGKARKDAKMKAEYEAQERELRGRWEKTKNEEIDRSNSLMKPHLDFMATASPATDEFTLADLAGSYLVQSYEMQHELLVDAWDALGMHVQLPKSPHGAVACMDFGFVKGMMLLALSEQSLRRFCEEMSAGQERPNEEKSARADAEAAVTVPGTRKRKRNGSAQKPKGLTPSVNRALGIGSGMRRVFFRWVGEDPKSREIEAGLDDVLNCGYLDFEASKGVARGRLAYFPRPFGKHMVALSLYKVSGEPREEPSRNWLDYPTPK
ncbi:hypothetical protein BJY01DRAFT_249821 [Aspergillus pseudoustus]|uniref:Uncharacterized protein n=1 Tax=Aspergillus pseudoustus TaxID=1810923 RepID=A0ABR4JLG6_9EURO